MTRQAKMLRAAVADVEQLQARAEAAEEALRQAVEVCHAARHLLQVTHGSTRHHVALRPDAWAMLRSTVEKAEQHGGVF